MVDLDRWAVPPGCVLMPYELFCDLRGDEPDPGLLGRTVRICKGEAELIPIDGEDE